MRHRYSEDEPRDDHGRWTDGGGSGDGGGSESVSTTPEGIPRPEWVTGISRQVKQDLNYDGPITTTTMEPPKFTVNGVQYQAAGQAFLDTGKIMMFTKGLGQFSTHDSVAGVVAHEIQHQKFQKAMDRHAAERVLILNLPKEQDVMRADGTLKPPYDEKYPNYNDMEKALWMPDSQSWMQGDGVSDYSLNYWIDYDEKRKAGTDGLATFNARQLAMHETLAEMARIKYQTGEFPRHMGPDLLRFRPTLPDGSPAPKPTAEETRKLTTQWRELFRTVDRVNKRISF